MRASAAGLDDAKLEADGFEWKRSFLRGRRLLALREAVEAALVKWQEPGIGCFPHAAQRKP